MPNGLNHPSTPWEVLSLIISPFQEFMGVGPVGRKIIDDDSVELEDSADPMQSSGAGMSF